MNEGDVPDSVGTDRRAVIDGEVSVSPLSVPHAAEPDAGSTSWRRRTDA